MAHAFLCADKCGDAISLTRIYGGVQVIVRELSFPTDNKKER